MTVIIITTGIYLIGYILFFTMLRIEHEADQEPYTKGDRAACIFMSLFSWAAILVLLIVTWVGRVKQTGYWDRPVKDETLNEIE